MAFLRKLLLFLAFASYVQGSEVELDLSSASTDNFDVVTFEAGPASVTRFTPKLGVYVNRVTDSPDSVWSPLSKDFSMKSFEIHQRSGHNSIGHLALLEKSTPAPSDSKKEETLNQNTTESLLEKVVFSNLYFTKRDKGWYPLTKYHFDVLKDEMESLESTLDLHNFSDSLFSVSHLDDRVTRELLLARRLSRVTRVNHNGDLVWSSGGTELFKSAALSYNTMNKLVLVKMTLTTPNMTYDPLDEKSTRYYVDRTLYFYRNKSFAWETVNPTFYEEQIDRLRNEFAEFSRRFPKLTLDLLHLVNGSVSETPIYYNFKFEKKEYRGMNVMMLSPLGDALLTVVKSGDSLLWVSENKKSHCRDVRLYRLSGGSTIVDLCLASSSSDACQYKFFGFEGGEWRALSPENYKHLLNNDEISVVLDLAISDLDFCTKSIFKVDGVPVTNFTALDGYYFDKVKELEFELWNSTRFLKCKKVFHVNLNSFNFISLLIEDPLSNTSHLLYYQKMSPAPFDTNNELVWVPISQAVHSSLMYSALMKISFDFDLAEFITYVRSEHPFPFDLNSFPKTKLDAKYKNYTLSLFRHKDVPMVRIYPVFASHLANFREGSNVIWSSKLNYKLFFLEFNYAEQPSMAMLMFSDEADVVRVSYYSRVRGRWNKVTVDEAQDYFSAISTVQDHKYFTLDVGKLAPSNKFTYNVEHLDSPPTAFVEPSYGYKVGKLVDGSETIWSSASVPTENSTAYGKVDGTKQTRGYETLVYASILPYNDPKFSIVVTMSQSTHIYLNHYHKVPDGSWKGVSTEEYFRELDKYSEEYYQGEEIVDLSDVFKGEKRVYYEFVDSSYFGLDHYGVLKFTDKVENLSLYVNGEPLYKFPRVHYLKEVILFPSNAPKVISLEYQFGFLDSNFLYFCDSRLIDVDPFVKVTTNYVEVNESVYSNQFEKLLMLKNYTTLDLSTYYKMVKDFEETNSDERDLVSYIHERLSNPTNNLTKGDSPLKHSVYNYLGVNFVVAEVNSDYLLKGVIDGPQIITGLNFYPSTKLYFTLNNDYYLSIYYTDGHSRELKTLNYEKWNHSWSYLKTSFRRGLQALVDFASKPVSVDMFHLRDEHGFNITTSQFSPDYSVNTLTPKPGYEIKRLYYNSILIYDTDNGISKQIGLKNSLENVIKVTFVPRLRPTLVYITSNTNSSILNKYYKITNAVNPNSPNLSKISLIKSINVFDYNSLLDTVKGVKEFLVDITDLHTTEDYRVSNHTVSTKAYAILTPNKDRNLVLLTQGKTTIWEAQDELVKYLILYPQNSPLLALIYYSNPDGDGVHRYRYMSSMNKWVKTTEEYALDTLKLNKDKLMPFTLDLSTLLNKTVKNKDFMMNQYINLYRRKIYGLLFTIVKPSFSTYITAVKHDDKVLFDINPDQSGVSDQSDRVLSVVYAFKDDPRILTLNFVRNFVPSQAYFRKNDEGDWEEISSSEYGKFLFLLKRFTMNPVVLDLDSPNPNFFTIFTDRSNKNITMTRITPKDSYKIWKVVRSNSSNLFDPFKELKLSDLPRRSVQSIEEVFSIQDTSVLYVEYTDGDPSLLRLYYNTDMLFQVRKAYFVLEDGVYKSTTEENFNHLLSLAKSAGTQVTYNLDPYYRHGSPSYRKDSYEEKVVTVYNDKFDLVYPNYEFNISPVMFKGTKVWEARPHYQTLSIASYPSKNPNQMMVHYKDLLKNVVYSQYYKLTVGSGPSDEVVWKPSTLYSNPVFDRNVRSLDFDLTDTRVHSTLTVFSFEREGLYTTVVLPNNDTLVGSISIDKRKIWTPNYDESTSVSEKLVKFYFTPSVDPKILVVYYRDFKGYVRLKDFKRELSSFEWKESYSKFMSYYLDMLDSSFPLNLQSYDKSKFIFSTYSKYGFKIVSLYPLLSTNITKIFSKPVDPNSDVVSDVADSELIWRSEALENCFSLHFAPPGDPKVLLVYYSEKSVSKSSLYYKDSLNGWILDNENTHRQFINRLLDFQNAFVYHLEDSNLSLPSEFYTYEYTDVFGVRFGVCTPKPGKNLVAVTDKSMYVYEIKTGERILDVLSAQPNNPDHLIIILDTNVKESDHQTTLITYKYLKKVRSWVEVGENEFLDSLMGSMSTAFSPSRLTTKDLHNRVLAQLSVGTSYGTFMDSTKELSPPSDYEHFTLDLANYKENNRFTVKNYVESTVPRTVLRLKRGYLLTQLIHADQSIWTNGPNESSPSGNERFATHVYFAPTEDPKVLTLFFRDSGSGVLSRRFVKNDVWTEFESLSHDLTNDSTLFTKLNKFVLDIHFDSVRYSSTIFKKELLYEDTTYFMKISPRDNVDVVKLVYKDSHLWDKGEFDNLKSVLVYPINCPKFAKILLSTDNGLHFFYFSRVNEFWSCTSEQEFKSSLKKYFSHSSEDFESVDLSNTKNYHNQTQKLNVHYANLHKLSFKSVSPRWDYKISKVVFGSPQPAGDSDLNDFDFGPFNFNTNTKTVDKDPTNSDLTVLFEPTSNEDIRLVSFSPEHDPKFVSITYTSTFNMIIPTTALPKLIDSPYSPNQSPEPVSGPTPPSSVSFSGDYAYLAGVPGYEPNYDGRDMSSPFYLSVNTNHYYLDGGVWSITDDATFKSMCLKWADDHFERNQPFDLDVDNLELNKEKYDMTTEDLAGVHFTKFQPKSGFEFSRILQYEKVVYRQFTFPILSFSVFPLDKPRFFKISHRMSPSLINNYFFVSFYPYGLSQRDYPSFKKALFDYLNSPEYTKPSGPTKVDICKTELTKTDLPKDDLHHSTLVLHGKNPDNLLYFVDYNKDSTSGYSLDYDTDSKEFKDVMRTYSGNLYLLDYYLVAPTNGHEFTRLYDKGNLVFELGENRVLKALLISPRTNPTYILAHYTCEQRFNFFQLYQKQDKWVTTSSTVKYKMKNIIKYHLFAFFDFDQPEPHSLKEPKVSLTKSPMLSLPSTVGPSNPQLPTSPFDKMETYPSFFSLKPVPAGAGKFMLHGHTKMSDLEEKLEFKYDLLKNVALPQDSNNFQTGLSALGFKFYTEDEKHYRLVFVDEPEHNITKLSVNDEVLLDLTKSTPYNTSVKEFSYDLESGGFTGQNFEVRCDTIDDKEYVVVNVTQGTLSKVLEGSLEVWDPKGNLVEKFAYYPSTDPDLFLVSYKVELENGESVSKNEYLHKVSDKWVEVDQENQLRLCTNLSSQLFVSSTQTNPRLLKGVLLMPAKDPVKLHVWFTENNFDKYVSFSRSLGKWTHTTLVFNDLVSVKLKFVTAQLRSDNVVFTGTPVPSLAEDRSSSKSKKILFESVSVNKHFFVDQPEKDHYFYLPLDNFKLSNVSYGKHCFFKNADPQTDAANTKKVLGVYLTVENDKTNFYGKVSRLTVLFEDLMANVHSHAWVRDPTNKWSRVSLTDKEVSALKDLLKETKSNLSKRGKLDTTVKFFSNFLSQTEKEQGARTGLKLSGRVLVPDTSLVFFNYDLLTDEMDIYVSSHKTLFYSSVKDDTFNSFKLLVVKEGYEATVLKTSDRVLYSASTDEKRRNKVYGDRIVAVYMTPATKPDSVCLYLSDRLGVKKLVSFRKQLDQSKGSDEWFESPLSSSYANLLKFKFDQAVSHSTSLRLECYDYTTGFFFGDNMIPHKQLTRSEYFVSTDSEVRNTPFRGFYSIFNESDNSTILIPLNNNKLSHIKCGTETLFSLSSQFHTVRALMITPKLNPDTVIVYYNDDENNDYYTSFTKLVPRTPAAPANPTSSVESTAQKLFVNPNKLWQERQLMFFSSLGTIKKIHSTLETFATNNPALVSSTPTGMNDSSKYNLTLTLTGVYTPEDGPAKEFVFFYDPNHKGSAYVFDDERVVEHKNVFDLVFKNSQYMSYLYVKSNPSYAVKSLMMDSQVLMDFEGSSEFDSLTLTSPLNPSVLLLTTMDSSSSMHYYFAKKDDKWQTMGLDMAKYLKMKVMLHNASEEMKLLDSYVKPESDVKRSSPVTMRKFDFNLSTHESFSEEYTLKKGSLSGYEFMVGRTRQNTNVGKILDSNLLVWNNFDNARVVRFGFSPPKDPSLLCVGYILDDKEVFDFFHKTGGEWHEYCTMKNVPSLLTHISGLNLSSFVLDLSAVDKDSEHFKLRTHYYNGVSIVSGFVSPHSTLTSVVDNGQDVLSKSKLVGIKVQTFVYSQSENPTYFGFYFTDKNKKQYELYHKQEHTWVPYFGMNEDGRLLLKELLHEKDTFDQLNPENQLFNHDNEFYYNISDSNNLSNKHYDVERQTTKPFDYVLVTVHKNQRLMKVLDNNLTVWTPKETVTQVLSFMYYPPDNPIYFSIASRTSSAREVQFEYYYKSENKWTPYTDPMNIPQILKLPLYSATESPSTTSPPKLVFDLSLDFSADFYKCLYDYNLTLYKDLLFETFVPKSGVEVTKVTDSFNVIYHKLSEEKITRISFYPNKEPKLLLVDVKNPHSHGTQKPLTRKFVLNNSWVVNDEEFDKRVLSYSKSEQKAVSVDLSQLTKGNTTFEDFLVVRESLNSAFETLVVTPILGKKIVSIFDGPQPVWLSREEACLDSCYFFPVDAPELLSVLSTDLDIRYYSKLNDKWSEVSSVAFEYLSSFYSGTSNTIELTHLSKFEPVLPLEDSYINLYDGFKLPSKEIKTRYDFLKTGLIKHDSILFGMASIKSDESESDKSPSSTTPHVLAITYSGEPLFKLNNDQKFLDLIFYPLDKPSMFTVTFLQGDDTLHKFFLRSASEKHEWYEVDDQHFDNLFSLLSSHKLFNPGPSDTLKQFAFDLRSRKSGDGFTLTKLSANYNYYSMYVLETHRLSVVKDKDLSVYEVPETDFVYNLYYNLDPKDTHLTLSYISSSPDFPPDSLGYLYFEKKNGEWNNSYSFTRKLLDHDQLLSSTQPSTPPTPAIPLNTNEFVYDMSKDKDSTVNFELRVETIRGVKLATVLPRAHKKLVHLVDSQVMVWSSGPGDKCYRVLYAPFDEPKATAVVYSASGQQTVKYFMKSPDGSWNETSPDDFTRVLIPEVVSKKVATKVSLDFSNLATKVLRPLQKEILKSLRNLMSKPGSKFVEEHLMSFMFYPVPKELVVTDLYDGDDLVYSSHIENVNALQFYATKNDLYLRVTTDFLDHKTSHYFYTTLKLENQQQNLPKQPTDTLPSPSTDTLPSPTTNSLQTKSNTEPVGCDKFTFDLSASNKTNKYFTLQHLTYLGHEQVYVKVHSDYLLSRVVDGKTVVWEQKGHVYLVNFGYMPEKNPSHLCLGLYCSKGHKLWYTFYYKRGGKWHLYTHDDKVPDALLKLSESLDSKTFFAFDLSAHSMSTDDYEIKEYEHLGQKYRIVNLHNLRVLFDIRDDKEIIWRFKNKKFALVFSYLPPENPNHLVVTCFTQNNLVHETFEKIDGKWILTDDDTTLRPQFSSQLIQSNLQYTTSPSAPVRCEKFTFDLTVHHESNDAFDLVRLTYLGHRQVYVKVHYDHVLTTLFDGKTVVWEQKGTVFLNNFGYLPEKNPSHLCLGLHCTKSHNLRHTFYYKKNGNWHLYSDDKDVPKELLELSNNLVSHFDFDMLSYSVFSPKYDLKVLYILDQAVVWVKVHPGSFLDSVVEGNLSVWVNDGKKQVVLFSFYSPEKPQYFVIMYVDDLGTMHTDYYFKDNGRWVPLTSSEDKVLENALLENSEDFSNLPAPSANGLPTTSTSPIVGCEKFTYDLSVHHESSDAFDLFHLTQLGHEQVYVKVHSDYVLTTLFDGKTVVWEQKGHVYLANFGYLPEKNPSHLCLGLYCSKGHKLWYTFYYKRDGKWQLYRHDDNVPDQLLELSKTLLLDHVSSFLDKRLHSQNEKLTPVLVRGEWQKIDKEEFYNNFLHVSVLREYATFDLKLLPDVGQYETKEGFEFGHPIRISNPMPDIHVGLILDGNEPVWKSNSVNEHVKSILTVHENEYKHLFSSTVRLIQLYIKDRDTISVKYFKRSQDDKWSEIIEKDYVSLYDNICKDFRSRKEFKSVDSESDKVDSDAETAASSTHLCPSPEDLLVTLSYADKESGSETTSQLKLNNCDKNFFVYTVDELQTVYVPILKDSVKKLRLDDFSFYEEDKVPRKLMAFFTKLNTDGTLQRVLLFFRDAYQPVYNAFVLDQGSWVSFSLLPDEESYLWDLVLKATGKTLFPVN